MSEFNFDLSNIDFSKFNVELKLPDLFEFKVEVPWQYCTSSSHIPSTPGIFSVDPVPTSPLNRWNSHYDYLARSFMLLTGGGGYLNSPPNLPPIY